MRTVLSLPIPVAKALDQFKATLDFYLGMASIEKVQIENGLILVSSGCSFCLYYCEALWEPIFQQEHRSQLPEGVGCIMDTTIKSFIEAPELLRERLRQKDLEPLESNYDEEKDAA